MVRDGKINLAIKKLYIQTFGCQMNVQDSEKMAALLQPSGYETTDDPATADLIIVNTCSIREKAAQKICSQLGRFRQLKAINPHLRIGVGGCLAQQWGENFFKKVPSLDLVFGTHQIHRLPEMVSTLDQTGDRQAETGFCEQVPSLDISCAADGGCGQYLCDDHAGVRQLLRLLRSTGPPGAGAESAPAGDRR